MGSGRKLDADTQRILDFVRLNPDAAVPEIAHGVGITAKKLWPRITYLRKVGYLPRADGTYSDPTTADSIRTAERRRERVEEIAATASDNIALSAIDRLEEMDRREGKATYVKPPLNDDEKVERLSRLIEACGPHLATKAFMQAKKAWDQDKGINWIIGGPDAPTENPPAPGGDTPPS